MTIQSCSSASIHKLLLAVLILLPASLLAEPVTLQQAVELALKHATGISIAAEDQQHASASYRELRNSYIPQLNAGAGIGWSDGFPLSLEGSAPSLFNVNAQSALINPALKDFIRATQSDIVVSTLQTKDQRNQVIQDTVLSYAELAKWEQRLSHLRETMAAAEQTETAVAQRVKEGVDSEIDGSKARLSVARLRLRLAEASGAADVLREHLSKLTGLPTASVEIDPDSVPSLPTPKVEEDSLSKAAEGSPVVQAAVEHARAQYLRAKAEHKSLWPSVDFAAQYALLADFNNYEEVYKKTQPNNATVGVSIHFPFLNYAQHERVKQAESEARKATTQAEAARNKVSEETLRLQRSVTQMQAARDVAELEYEISQKDIEATRTRMDSGTANLHDLDNAQAQASERLITLQDVTFELERSQVALMRANGDLERWALGAK
ncbi:MAG TPA: TolC family protein [Terriglobales bacterium]|jgi:outer membrane protein TolC|nr:TolC family protein [Terriglobales bacterium]